MDTQPSECRPELLDPRLAAKKSMFVLEDGRNVLFVFSLLILLFALWGFCNGMIDVMDKHFQEELHLSLAQSAWVQFAHYLGYFLMALPAGWLATKLGYKGGIITGLLMVAVGGFWFIPATHIASFWAFLLGVCLIAAGLTFLETIANPYTTVLGPIQYAATRINLAQSCNGIGLLLGPVAGGMFFYSKNAAGESTGNENLWIPYAAIGVIVIVLAIIFYFSNVPDINLASLGFLCFLIGRFTGSAILKKFSAHTVLGLYSATAVVLCALVFLKLGWISVACVFLTYFFMSIMFPTIFALGIFGLGERAKKASSFVVMAIMGGAVLPKVMGSIADKSDLSRGFIVPMLCFAVVAAYGFMWPRLSGAQSMHGVSTSGGH
jgi:fucose permease